MKVKQLLVAEIVTYPPLVRRELLANVLTDTAQTTQLIRFAEMRIVTELGEQAAIEIELLKALKQRRLSVRDIEKSMTAG